RRTDRRLKARQRCLPSRVSSEHSSLLLYWNLLSNAKYFSIKRSDRGTSFSKLGKKTEPLTEIRWMRRAGFGRLQIQIGEPGAGNQSNNEQRAAAPSDRTALHDFNDNFNYARYHPEYAANRLKQKPNDDSGDAEQCAADRDERKVR
ncbi:MAG: hypothetical protein OXG84_02425, partial [Chloroflexi bacterium]|nr:hypothetical protein [Chloroflexota bacterium]